MFYVFYTVGILFYIAKGIGCRIMNFTDPITGFYILTPCILALFCTKSFPAFGRSFLLVLSKKEASALRYEESLQSVQMVMLTAVISGILCFLIGTINSCRSLSFECSSAKNMLLRDMTVAILSLFYPMLICLLLLPVPFLLKRNMSILRTKSNEKENRLERHQTDEKTLKCVIVKELLSNYANSLTSEETRGDILHHLKTCSSCRKLYEKTISMGDTK